MKVWHEQDNFWETMPILGQVQWDLAPGQVDSLISLLEIEPGSAVLDLCCGHPVPLRLSITSEEPLYKTYST